jgi:crotonobetainyl-CoA:carnitine CoA-transferase CaiB-like acyl-CoA transferase
MRKAANPPAGGPLAGVRVLDLSSVMMGPYATQLLGDMGADVILVEQAAGDKNRSMGEGPHPQLSGIALNLLRNKRDICLNLKDPRGREACLRLAATCDVLVTNLRPGALRRLGLGYDDVAASAPAIVYCQAHGYPSDSPAADLPAFDDVIQAASGMADLMRRVCGLPLLAPSILADKVCGLTIAYAVCAALYARAASGRGQYVEVPMIDTMRAFVLAEHGAGAISDPPQAAAGYNRILTDMRRAKRTADGWIHVMPYSEQNWRDILTAAGRPELVSHPALATIRLRHEHSAWLYQLLEELLPAKTTAEWLAFCAQRDIPATEVASIDALVGDLTELDHPVAGRYRTVPFPVRFADGLPGVRRGAPLIGQHNEELLGEAGYQPAEIASLVAAGVARSPER